MRRRLLATAALVVVASLGVSPALAATQLSGPPDQNGNKGVCNADFTRAGLMNTSTPGNFYMACQVPTSVNGTTVQAVKYLSSSGFGWQFKNSSNNLGDVNFYIGGTAQNSPCMAVPATATKPAGQVSFSLTGVTQNGGTSTTQWTTVPTSTPGTWQTLYSDAGCTAGISTGGTLSVTYVSTADSMPSFPDNFYSGGQAGGAQGAPCFNVTPATVGNAPVTEHFDATCSANAQASSFAWTFPASNNTGSQTTGTLVDRSFSANDTYTVTLSQTLSGVTTTFSKDVVIPTPSGSGTADSGDCPTGWGFLNPLAFGKVLRCLFEPSGTQIQDAWSALYTSATTHYPFAMVVFAGTIITDAVNGISGGHNTTGPIKDEQGNDISTEGSPTAYAGANGHPTVESCSSWGFHWTLPSVFGNVPTQGAAAPGSTDETAGSFGGGHTLSMPLFDNCGSSPLHTIRSWSFMISTGLALFWGVMYLWNTFMEHAEPGGYTTGGIG